MSNIYSSLENLQASVKRRWIDYSQRITASLEIKKQRGHLLVLDGVRAAACLAVLLQHIIYQVVLITGLWKPAGKIQVLLASALNFGASAVILFFLLSSFLLFLPFAKALLFDGQWPSVSRFFISRSSTSFPQNVLAALQPYYYGDNGKYFEAFAVGMLIALLYVYTQNTLRGELLRAKLLRWSPWMFLAGLFILGFLSVFAFYLSSRYHSGLAFLDPYRTMLGPMYMQWQSICYSICYGLCMCALLYNSSWLRRPFEWPG